MSTSYNEYPQSMFWIKNKVLIYGCVFVMWRITPRCDVHFDNAKNGYMVNGLNFVKKNGVFVQSPS